ncbi:hypothetical protein [Thermotoga profunda]|uniref:hypothetical protein n=1 Tax=Thermotoga profunda TaxID=1508420 RepID=UPI000694C7F3|nr:hypothetical protein [Thermotoga profunda]
MRISVIAGLILLVATCLFANTVLINDPDFVKLTAVQNFSHNLWWATDYVLEIQALNRNMPVEVSYLILDGGGTPSEPSIGVQVKGNNFIEGWEKTSFFQTEVGGWGSPEFQQNPKYLPLPHYRTCILMLARYEKIYFVVIRENDGQISYKVLQGGPFKPLEIPSVVRVTRDGPKFTVASLGQPVEVGLWAKGSYMHDEVGGWASAGYTAKTKQYDIPHYGMFMMMVGRYDKIALIIGNENDGKLGAITLYGGQQNTHVVADLCVLTTVRTDFSIEAISSDPVEITHFGFDNTCWQWEVNGWGKPEYRASKQTFRLKHYTPSLIFVNRYNKVGLFFYNENDGIPGFVFVR